MKRASVVPKFGKEVVLEASKLSNPEARFLVANYYLAQEMRKRTDMQLRHLGEKELPQLLNKTADGFATIEDEVRKSLQKYAESSKVGEWCLAQDGIGPVISAGLLAHLDIEKAPSAGHFWSFAGLNPEQKWEKGQKRPYNADLRQICWHLGQCAKRISWKETAFYGQLYKARKAYVVAKNDAGGNRDRTESYVTTSPEVRKKLEEGKLPDGNLDNQACNFVAKIFLSHLHSIMYWDWFGQAPAKPYAITHLGHVDMIHIPHGDMFPGFEEVYYDPRRGR